MLTFGSVCSGIEAASVAWEPLGWRAAWFAEVDAAASAVLSHRFPDVPNHGDMTKLAARVRRREIPAPDILVGGTPCQSFSIAGLRGGLSDARGQLTLSFVDLANAIDEIRIANGQPPVIIVWENVPGVFTHADNPLGCFLAGLAGDDVPLEPGPRPELGRSAAYWTWDKKTGLHRPKWPNAGCAAGPQRAVAWRTLDAQWFDLAQRRNRAFVVASAREGFDPTAILLEFDGVRRDSPPSREAGEDPAGTLDARAAGGGFPGTDGACDGHVVGHVRDHDAEQPGRTASGGGARRVHGAAGVAFGGNNTSGPIDVATARNAHSGPHGRLDFESETFVLQPSDAAVPTWWDGRDVSQTLDAVLHKGQTMPEKNRFPAVLQPVVFHPTQDPIFDEDGLCHALGTGSRGGSATAAIAFSVKDYGGDVSVGVSPTLRSMGHDGSHANGGGQVGIAYAINSDTFDRSGEGSGGTAGERAGLGIAEELAYALKAKRPDAVAVLPFDTTQVTSPANRSNPREGDTGHPLAAGAHPPAIATTMAVRRLMPIECERLQGFPDGWTLVPTGKHGKPAADGPRYKQCGNSMATNVMSWIGGRIKVFLVRREPDEFELLLGHNNGPPLDDFEAFL